MRIRPADLITEHKVVILPGAPDFYPFLELAASMTIEKVHCLACQSMIAAARRGLWCVQIPFSAFPPMDALPDLDDAVLLVVIGPPQPQELAGPTAGIER
ncbi:MAG: hypothetical protein L0220_06670 [Acidobacteria bacterium]|nr:hypothetical protein [Acidobacteriota bacterium]